MTVLGKVGSPSLPLPSSAPPPASFFPKVCLHLRDFNQPTTNIYSILTAQHGLWGPVRCSVLHLSGPGAQQVFQEDLLIVGWRSFLETEVVATLTEFILLLLSENAHGVLGGNH